MRAATRSIRRSSRAAAAQTALFSTSKAPGSSSNTAAYLAIGGGAAAAAFAAVNGVVPHEWLIRQLAEPMMPVVRLFDPETAHKIAVQCARFGLTPKDPETDPELLRVKAFGLDFSNPLGIAAGFDKDGEAMEGMLDIGFGCVEIGSVTPKPQPGNPKPRVFRLAEDRGVINRYGFNSKGLEAVGARLERYVGSREKRTAPGQGHRAGVLGVNLGKNKTTEDAAADYVQGVHALGKYADYLVVNVSSPNTPGLRTLQGKIQLQELLVRVLKARDEVAATEKRDIPLLVKIAPDLTEHDKEDIAAVALELKLDGLVVSNTTLSRPDTLKGEAKGETGGLSGLPVRDLSTKVLGDMYKLTNGQIPLIGVGGVANGQDAYDKIRAGASLVQMYSCLIYESPLAVPRAKKELAALLGADGYESVADAVGAAHK
ncbi:Dihydroorotate dehydrogenase (quinone), mitochondrial [Phytophthora boehmeriae]|uniref:Dihydroorotate dehydrogenase (quinone), mitochondrial n=1 Tax=Phytophthora boehmeriae TaxID=109152 RepID=A0A8T1WUB4_9STRA|nr:Dihydroorotate dehydrogenase (quinone), mitochondrial [Phytophthora boehmeriae]